MVDIKSHFIHLNLVKVKVDEYLAKTFMRAGYAKVDLVKTPLGTRVVIYADRPAFIIGKKGQTIRQLTELLEKYFKVENPQITVTQVENPELNARVVATRLALAIEKGYHFRRAAFVALRRALGAGAIGVEIVISGKIISERAKYEKIRSGKVYKTGDHVYQLVDRAVVHLLQKPGIYGIEVSIVKPLEPVDRIEIVQAAPPTPSESSEGTPTT
ncbi:MAG: 30S ribosomal protein S3 [Sulfolobales archaeon]|nr:30S ribosomal protein S3 [Sulfolobales archaeon]MCX8186384.1 30S ribosomal protein S3 [Sulfolobales archaeon]MDW7968881.1 30S ribosomal protein S3 [Sulfolobales archaeon]